MRGIQVFSSIGLAVVLSIPTLVSGQQTAAIARSNVKGRLTSVANSVTNLRPADSQRAAKARYEAHPLWPTLEMAVSSYKDIRKNVRDYSCTLVRQERVNGRLMTPELMTAKVRHQRTRNGKVAIPFGVYLKVASPARVKGREVLYVDGENDGDMLVRNGGKRFAYVTIAMKPDSPRALRDNRYSLTEFGLENLVKRLIEVVKEDIRSDVKTDVEFLQNASINGRSCTGVHVTHPDAESSHRFHKATVLIDTELKVPVHYEAYGWPTEDDGRPPLLEKYTYRDIKLNVGYTAQDFDKENPSYKVK